MATVVAKARVRTKEQKIKRSINASLRRGVSETAAEIADDIRESLQEHPGGGRTYRIYRYGLGGKVHTASNAGETPVNLTGALRDSIGWELKKDIDVRGVAVRIGVVHEYDSDHPREVPYWLEFGTPDGKMAPRPFILPAMARARASGLGKKLRYNIVEAMYEPD